MSIVRLKTVIKSLLLLLAPRKIQSAPLKAQVGWELLPYSFEVDWYVLDDGQTMLVRETLHLSGNAVRQSLTFRRNR